MYQDEPSISMKWIDVQRRVGRLVIRSTNILLGRDNAAWRALASETMLHTHPNTGGVVTRTFARRMTSEHPDAVTQSLLAQLGDDASQNEIRELRATIDELDAENPVHGMFSEEGWREARSVFTQRRAEELARYSEAERWLVLDRRDGLVSQDAMEEYLGRLFNRSQEDWNGNPLSPDEMLRLLLADANTWRNRG